MQYQPKVRIGMIVDGSFTLTRERIALYGKATDDMNPIHFSTEAARTAGFTVSDEQVIAHGKLVLGCADALFVEHFPNTILLEMDRVRFVQPVRSDDTVEIESKVTAIVPIPEKSGARITIQSRFRVNGRIVIGCTTHAFTKLPYETPVSQEPSLLE